MDKKEIVIVMGIQGSGKSTVVEAYTRHMQFVRLNRDEVGGSLDRLNAMLEERIRDGYAKKFVLDNTYGTKAQRAPVIAIAKKHGFNIVCDMMTTSIEDAQFNVAWRILSLSPKNVRPHLPLGPDGGKLYPNVGNVPVIALFAYQKAFEAPNLSEGFTGITTTAFNRSLPKDYVNKAILLDYDGTLRRTEGKQKYPVDPSEVRVLPNRAKVLERWKKTGYLLLGVSNQSGIEKGDLNEQAAIKCFEETNRQLGMDIPFQYCPHHSFPIRCYCRKPLPGLGVFFIREHKLKPSDCIMVGDATSDKTFAKRCGFQYVDQKEFFRLKH